MKRSKLVYITALISFLFVFGLSVLRFVSYNAAHLDIGYMSQAIWSATKGQSLLISYPHGTFSRLRGHSELIYFLVAIVYKFWSSPIALLFIQALLYSSAFIALYFLAYQRLENHRYAYILGLIYLLYPVAMTAVLFDFHGDTLAMPLIMISFYFLFKRDLFRYALFILLSLACKIYVVLPVGVFGLVLFLKNRRKESLLTLLLGVFWIGFVYILRHLYFEQGIVEGVSNQVTGYAGGHFSDVFLHMTQDINFRALHLIVVLLPALFLGYRALLWMAPGLVITFSVIVSTGPGPGFDYRYHHYALAVPFFALSMIEGGKIWYEKDKEKVKQKVAPLKRFWENSIYITFASTIIFNLLFVQTPLSPQFYMIPYLGSNDIPISSIEPRDDIKEKITSEVIPPGSGVLADIFLASHMPNRSHLYSTYYTDTGGDGSLIKGQSERILGLVDYVVIDVFSVHYHSQILRDVLQRGEFSLIFSQDGLLVFSKVDDTFPARYQVKDVGEIKVDYGLSIKDPIQLQGAQLQPLDDGRYKVRFSWRLVDVPPEEGTLIAVSKLEGVNQARIVHLPTVEALHRGVWEEGEVLEEEFVVDFPEYVPEGSYRLSTAWYDSDHPGFPNLNPKSRLTGKRHVGWIHLGSP